MKWSTLVLLAALIVVLGVGCGDHFHPRSDPCAARVQGSVVDAATREPIVGVKVVFLSYYPTDSVYTSAGGIYQITTSSAVPRYRLRFSYVGYVTRSVDLPDGATRVPGNDCLWELPISMDRAR